MHVEQVFEIAERALARGSAPLVLFTYFNPVMQYGLDRFAARLRAIGAAGAIVPDVPLEELAPLREAFERERLELPLLIAPTTSIERASRIALASSGFLYIVSRLGVTSAQREPDFDWIAGRVAELRAITTLPLVVGFGISTPAHVARVCAIADGAIVGSALVAALAGSRGVEAGEAAAAFLTPLALAAAKEASSGSSR